MSQNRRTVSKIEFNKRIRDLVSRDSNRLRQTFQKFDKECACRLAEIQSMQEKVRHSMRNLTQEKMQAQLSPAAAEHDLHLPRRECETERVKSAVQYEDIPSRANASGGRMAFTPEERRKSNNKASLPGISYTPSEHLKVPSSGEARSRRYSLPYRPTFLPGSPKENRTFLRAPIGSSLPKEVFMKTGSPIETSPLSNLSSSMKQSSSGIHLQHHKNGYRLSIHNFPISLSRSDNLSNVRVKMSPQLDRRDLKTLDPNEDNHGESNDYAKEENGQESSDKDAKNPRRISHPPCHPSTTMVTEPRRVSDPNNVKSKPLVKRTRSSSLPVDPEMLFKDFKLRESHSATSDNQQLANGKRESLPLVPKKNVESSPSPFEELRRCRYLRSDDAEA